MKWQVRGQIGENPRLRGGRPFHRIEGRGRAACAPVGLFRARTNGVRFTCFRVTAFTLYWNLQSPVHSWDAVRNWAVSDGLAPFRAVSVEIRPLRGARPCSPSIPHTNNCHMLMWLCSRSVSPRRCAQGGRLRQRVPPIRGLMDDPCAWGWPARLCARRQSLCWRARSRRGGPPRGCGVKVRRG
jgi:hypothetical protein